MPYETPKPYREDACEECGTCLSTCPVMGLSEQQAIREIRKIRQGLDSPVLRRCTSCLDCDFACPNSCNPGELILSRWRATTLQRGVPERARYFLPHSQPNFRTYLMDRMTPREKSLVESWKDMTPAEEVCYPGCNVIATPLLTSTRALDGLDIRGSLDVCCGEMYFRMGLFDQLREVAKKTQGFFDALGASKVTILCTAGYYIFTEVLPHFGADFSFEMEPYLALLKRRLDSGELRFTRSLGMKVTVQDSCYGKQFGPDYLDLPREILARAGCEIVESRCSRECMLCCGIGAGFSPASSYHPLRLTASTLKVMHEAKRSGADAVATYCSGCMQMFDTGRVIYRNALPAYHLLELVSMALGEQPELSHSRLGRQMLTGMLLHQTPALLSRRRFTPPPIE